MAMTRIGSLFVIFVLYKAVGGRTVEDARYGCTPGALPNTPFFAVWNVPSTGCNNVGVNLNLTAYGIVDNTGDQFIGDKISLFYNLGPWPRYAGNTPINGGVPQEGNLNEFLTAAKATMNQYMPKTYDGLGVIDFESWRPHYYFNFGSLRVYQTASLNLVKKEHPQWSNQTKILQEAIKEFDTAARAYMQTALQLAIQQRPEAYWGYYGYPRCWGAVTGNECVGNSAALNDLHLHWLFEESTGLYPRIYVNRKQGLHYRYLYVREQVNETLRVQAKYSNLNVPIVPYSLEQDSATDFFTKEDLQVSAQEPAAMGASGVVFWGSSSLFHTVGECQKIQHNVNHVLGPFIKNLTDTMAACANTLCHNHGRCVRKDYESITQHYLRMYRKERCLRPQEEYENLDSRRQNQFEENFYVKASKFNNYICRCLTGYHGEYCNKSV